MVDKRSIRDLLPLREDLSPFLVHLTRRDEVLTASENLCSIVKSRKLYQGNALWKGGGGFSDASLRSELTKEEEKRKFFGFVSFTEAPLSQLHLFFDIKKRSHDLEPYGLVFFKEKLAKKGVSPVLYLNNSSADKHDVIDALCSLIKTEPSDAVEKRHSDAVAKILPLVAIFARQLTPIDANRKRNKLLDFSWEREWRYPGEACFAFDPMWVFAGLCPKDEIEEFENLFSEYCPCKRYVRFIDPTNAEDIKKIDWKIKKAWKEILWPNA